MIREFDDSERKRAEESLKRLNRELRAISNCNQVLMKAEDEQSLLGEICRIVCEEAGYRMAWVAYPENDADRSIRPAAWAGEESGYIAELRLSWGEEHEHGRGPAGTVIRTGETICVQDFVTDPRMAPWRENALRHGYRSGIALPLKDEKGIVFGVFLIYAAQPDAFPQEEIRLMEELAGDLAFGITALRGRNARKEAERNSALLRVALDNVHEAAFLIDETARFNYVNEESCRVLGYSRTELLAMGVTDVDPDFPPERWPAHWQELETKRTMTFEGRHRTREGRLFPVEISANFIEYGGQKYNLALVRDMSERRQAEDERLTHLRFFEHMDRVNRAMHGADDLEQMMSDVLDVVLSVFACDRAFLMYPCDPGATAWRVPVERNRPEYPGVLEFGLEVPMTPDVAETLRILLAADGPVRFGPGTPYPLPEGVSERFGFKCFMSMAIYPKIGQPWQFGVHNCSYARIWTMEEERLLKEIGRRLADSMTSLLMYRDLQESEQRYRMVFENSPVSIWEEDFSGVKGLFDELKRQGVTDIEPFFDQNPETVRQCVELTRIINVNQSALTLHGASGKDELFAGLVNTFTEESLDTFRQELVCLWNGGTELVRDAVVKTLTGEPRFVTVYFSVCPGYEETLAKVIVSLADISDRKQAEKVLQRLNEELEQRVQDRTAALEAKNSELERMNKIFIGRELKMVELKERIRELEGKTTEQ